MRVLLLHNAYGVFSGEERQEQAVASLLTQNGHDIRRYSRTSVDVRSSYIGRCRAFFTGIYNPFARRAVREIVRDFRPEVALVQNVYPLISPSVIPELAKAGVPVLMQMSNYRLVCPNGLLFSNGAVCHKCVSGREYWCALRNCEQDICKSLAYAMRASVARQAGWFRSAIARYLCASSFMARFLVDVGIAPSRIRIIPNIVPVPRPASADAPERSYVGYIGRLSPEKGIHLLIDAARTCPDIPFRVAGSLRPEHGQHLQFPQNLRLVGAISPNEVASFYRGARFTVMPSLCYETFGLSAAESMLFERPVIAPRHGVFPEFVADGQSGVLFEPGSALDLARNIRQLWEDPDRCRELGVSGRKQVEARSSPTAYYRTFTRICGELGIQSAV